MISGIALGILAVLIVFPLIHIAKAPYEAYAPDTQKNVTGRPDHSKVDGEYNTNGNQGHTDQPQAAVIAFLSWRIHSSGIF
jgi:hypothetical protein